MNFLIYLKVNYFRGIQPGIDSSKTFAGPVAAFLIYLISTCFLLLDCCPALVLCSCAFFVPAIYGAQEETRPSVFCLYPVTAKKKILYQYMGTAVFTFVMSAVALLYITVFSLVFLALPGNLSVFLASLMSFFNLDIYAAFLVTGMIIYSFGSAHLYAVLKKYRKCYIVVFSAVNWIITALLFTFIVFDGGEEGEILRLLVFRFRDMPLNVLYLVYFFTAGTGALAASVIVKLKRAEKAASF